MNSDGVINRDNSLISLVGFWEVFFFLSRSLEVSLWF